MTSKGHTKIHLKNTNPLMLLAKNIPETTKIQHHAVTRPLNWLRWDWDTRPNAKYLCLGYIVPSTQRNQPTQPVKYVICCYWNQTKFTRTQTHIQSMVAKRGLTNRANVHTWQSEKVI